MKRISLALIVMMVIAALLAGCAPTPSTDESEMKVMPSATNFDADIDINSPEGLAKESSEIYRQLLSSQMSIKDGFNALLKLASGQSAQSMLDYEDEFSKQIGNTIDYFESEKDAIVKYEFAKTEYTGDDAASIKRIQIQQSGKKYYFQQDFVKEEGVWKIKGDNVTNDFVIKQKFLFWYI